MLGSQQAHKRFENDIVFFDIFSRNVLSGYLFHEPLTTLRFLQVPQSLVA